MKMLFPFLTLLCSAISLLSQPAGFADPDSILAGGRPLPRVLLVGTWHFDYPGLDAHVTSEEHKMNIFSEKRQRELAELLDYIARFQPNKIAVEGVHSFPTRRSSDLGRASCRGKSVNPPCPLTSSAAASSIS